MPNTGCDFGNFAFINFITFWFYLGFTAYANICVNINHCETFFGIELFDTL